MGDEGFTILEQVPSVVHINVGGQLFLTSRSTLYKVPDSRIARMFNGDEVLQKVNQNEAVYFLDRDPRHFQRILTFLRDGSCVIPSAKQDRQELLAEAQYYQLTDLEAQIQSELADYSTAVMAFDFKSMVLQHHAETGRLQSCMDTFLAFVRDALVPITPVTDVSDNLVQIYWLSSTMPPADPLQIVFRYRGIHESNDVGMTVAHTDPKFADWNRMWDIWRNKELTSAFKILATRHGLKVQWGERKESFKQENQQDVIWKMYRVRAMQLTIGADSKAFLPAGRSQVA